MMTAAFGFVPLPGTDRKMKVFGEAARDRRSKDGSMNRKRSHEPLTQVQAVVLLGALMFVASCGSSEDTATASASTQTTVVGLGTTSAAPNASTSDPGTSTSELTTTSSAPLGPAGIQVSEPTSDQVAQWMEAMLPLQLTQVAPEIAPATCDDGWISGVTVLPTALSDGEFTFSCVVDAAQPIFVSLTEGTICIPGLGETLEELIELCLIEPMYFVREMPAFEVIPYEAILSVNGEHLPTPGIVATGIQWTDVSSAEPITSPIVYAGYNALLQLEAGQHTIVTGYRSLEDGSNLSTTTIELTVNN